MQFVVDEDRVVGCRISKGVSAVDITCFQWGGEGGGISWGNGDSLHDL